MSAMRRPERRRWRRMASSGEFFGEFAGELGALGFVFGEEDLECGMAATEEGSEDAVDQDDAGAFGAGHGVRTDGYVLGFYGGGF